MKKADFVVILLVLFLIAAAVWTIIFGGARSRHGVGMYHARPVVMVTTRVTQHLFRWPSRVFCLEQ